MDTDPDRPVSLPLIQTSPGLGKLAAALAKAQAAYKTVLRSREVTVTSKSTGTRYTFSYAPLDVVLDATLPALSANGLSVTQELSGTSQARFCTTTLMHESGEWRSSTLQLLGAATTTAQEFGSQVTYVRRYTLQCVAVVAAEEDDDANHADGNEVSDGKAGLLSKAAKRTGKELDHKVTAVAPKLDSKVQARIKILQAECGIEDREWHEKLAYHYEGVESSADLSAEQAQDLIRRLTEVKRSKVGAAPQPATSAPSAPKSEGQG